MEKKDILAKKNIRMKIIKKRLQFSNKKLQKKSHKIINFLINLNAYLNSQNIGLYWSINNEVLTSELINHIMENQKTLLLPRIISSTKMNFYKVSDLKTDLENNQFGILEPKADLKLYKQDQIDLIIVPIVAFDEDNNRIGYGKGYYDRYLSNYKGIKIGIAFKEQKFKRVPFEKNDIKMDRIIYF